MRPTIEWSGDKVILIDQRKLPAEEVYVVCRNHLEVAEAIEKMVIRGAPAIGVAAAFGVALGLFHRENTKNLDEQIRRIIQRLKMTRPTARNLFWALERMQSAFEKYKSLPFDALKQKMVEEALAVEREDIETNRKIGSFGKELIKDGDSVLTHCNAGGLATAGYGTAVGVIRSAFEEGKRIKVFVDETRPFLQGARLTVWELSRLNIPHVLITDNAAGWLMQRGEISLAITGADRIARNGDTANKIGTYSAAVLATENRLPFYVAAPVSSIDLSLADGGQIPIEERSAQEVREIGGNLISLPEVEVRNPAFDVTPSRYVSAIITEKGIIRPPYEENLAALEKNDS
ncbi:MAG: S-methyl-5-thioribose-1-phosphate isomerase [Candidatus Aminicenantales bacterium]